VNLVAFGRRNPALLALNVLVLTLVLMLLALNASRLPFLTGREYSAAFRDASGLQEGEEVRVAGLKVGLVRHIKLDRGQVLVTFDVSHVRLGRSTTASIEVKTLLGQHYLAVTPLGSGDLDPDRPIPVTRTTSPLNVVPAFQKLTRHVQRIDTDQVAHAFDSVSGILKSSTPEVRGTLVGLSRLSQTVSSRDAQLRDLFTSADAVTKTVAARDKDIAHLLGSSDQVLHVLDQRRAVITRIIAETSALATQLRGLVADNRQTIGPALDKLNRVLTVLRANRANLDESLRLTGLYGREFSNVGGTGRFFDGSITAPRGVALCTVSPRNALSGVIDPLLSSLNEAANGSSAPCLPFGPASDSRGQ
jgi:phospholipid/cholesterol/gamma-HCH transport system substrate-binding protein